MDSVNLVYAGRCGNRVKFSKSLTGKLGNPKRIQFALKEDCLIIGEKLLTDSEFYGFASDKSYGIIYNAALVKSIVEHFNLNFAGKTSMSFNDIEVKNITTSSGRNMPVAYVKVVQ